MDRNPALSMGISQRQVQVMSRKGVGVEFSEVSENQGPLINVFVRLGVWGKVLGVDSWARTRKGCR